MTKLEWQLKKENLRLNIELARAQSALLQKQHDAAVAEYQAMGEAWVEEKSSEPIDK